MRISFDGCLREHLPKGAELIINKWVELMVGFLLRVRYSSVCYEIMIKNI